MISALLIIVSPFFIFSFSITFQHCTHALTLTPSTALQSKASASVYPNFLRAECQFSRPNYSNWLCSLQNCPVLVQLSHINPPRPQFNVSIHKYHLLPLPLAQIRRFPDSTRFPCFLAVSSRYQHPNSIRLSSIPWTVKSSGNEQTPVIVVILLAIIAVSLPLILIIRLDSRHCFYHFYSFIQSRILPCLPTRTPPSTYSVSSSQHDNYQYLYITNTTRNNSGLQFPQNIATRNSTDSSTSSHRYFNSVKEIDQLISSTTLSEVDANKLRSNSWICCICLDDQETDSQIAQLHCGHAMHSQCLYKWFKKGVRQTCCLCNAKPFSDSLSPSSSVTSCLIRGDDAASSSDRFSLEVSQVGIHPFDSEFLDDSNSEQVSVPSLTTLLASAAASSSSDRSNRSDRNVHVPTALGTSPDSTSISNTTDTSSTSYSSRQGEHGDEVLVNSSTSTSQRLISPDYATSSSSVTDIPSNNSTVGEHQEQHSTNIHNFTSSTLHATSS